MKKSASVLLLAVAFLSLTAIVGAESSMSGWPYFAEVKLPANTAGTYQLSVPVEVLDKAREDLADLRLLDAAGREIPYALRVRKDVDEQREFGTRLFNRATVGTATEVSIDLHENPVEHNEIRIETAGSNFRRRVEIEGSDAGSNWRTLTTGGTIFRFQSQNRMVDSNRVSYPLSRFRYLRLRVQPDELTDKNAPDITAVTAMMVGREPGMLITWDAGLAPYQLLRNQGAPASSWTFDLGGRVPCDRLYLAIGDESFSRAFQVEVIDDPQNIRSVAAGELTRRVGENNQPLMITFDHEEHARKLRMIVTDYNNPTLSLQSVQAAAPARQIYFELKDPAPRPVRLFFGNPKSIAPHYDFEKELPPQLVAQAQSASLSSFSANPEYRPEPLPFTERAPWLIYVVLTASSLVLGLILFSLARATLATNPAAQK